MAEIPSLSEWLHLNEDRTWKCPICNAVQKQKGELTDEYYCPVCTGSYTLRQASETADLQYQFFKESKKQYEMLQEGEFEKVSKWAQEKLHDRRLEKYFVFLHYLKFRADFNILGPIVTASGENTKVFTPCVVEKFDPAKISDNEDFQALIPVDGEDNDRLAEIRDGILKSAEEYTSHWQSIKENKVEDFDIFICHKTDTGSGKENTDDYKIGKQMYEALTKSGYKVFFAPETKKKNNALAYEYASNWREWIYDALITSELMILIGTKEEYIYSPNVKNEWVTFKAFEKNNFYGTKRFLYVTDLKIKRIGDSVDSIESHYGEYVNRNKLNVKKFLEGIHKHDYKINKDGNKDGILNNPFKKFTFADEGKELGKLHNMTLASVIKDSEIIPYAERIWNQFGSKEAALEMGLIKMREAKAHKKADERERCYKQAYGWFCKGGEGRAAAYKAFCLYNGRGCAENKEAAMEILSGSSDDLGRYYYALFVLVNKVRENDFKPDELLELAVNDIKDLRETLPEARTLYEKCRKYKFIDWEEDEQ